MILFSIYNNAAAYFGFDFIVIDGCCSSDTHMELRNITRDCDCDSCVENIPSSVILRNCVVSVPAAFSVVSVVCCGSRRLGDAVVSGGYSILDRGYCLVP